MFSEDLDDDYKNIIQYLLYIIIVKCCLKEENDEMSEKLASERSVYIAEQCNLQELLSKLQLK